MDGAKLEVTLVEGSNWPLNLRVLSSFEDNSATVALTRREASKLITVLLLALTEGEAGSVFVPDGLPIDPGKDYVGPSRIGG
jgi:hypothetical protein